MMKRFEGVLIVIIGLMLICLATIFLVMSIFDYVISLFVGGTIFVFIGFYFIEVYKRQEEKTKK
ncbi:MAG: hypothetical protein QXD48_03985 [Candidatus Aenigmatarchaeota archaeon]